MKKYLVVLIALLFATGAFAQEAEKKAPEFKYGFYGIAYGVKGQIGVNEWDYSHVRVKPSFSMGNENVKGVVVFEIDQDLGANAKDYEGNSRSSADNGTDNKDVEVKHAYFEAKNVLIPNFTLMAGLNGFVMPLVADSDYGMAQASYDFGMGKAVFSYLKHEENTLFTQYEDDSTGDTKIKRDDVESYAFQIPVKAGAININPGVLYTVVGKEKNSYIYRIYYSVLYQTR